MVTYAEALIAITSIIAIHCTCNIQYNRLFVRACYLYKNASKNKIAQIDLATHTQTHTCEVIKMLGTHRYFKLIASLAHSS